MPAIQSKVVFDSKPTRDDGNAKVKSALKSRNKDHNTYRKKDCPLERSTLQRRKIIVPELDLQSLSSKSKAKNKIQGESPSQVKVRSSSRSALKSSKKRGMADVSKSNVFMSEMETYRSLFSTSTGEEPFYSVPSLGHLNPSQLADSYFDCNEADECFRNQYPDFEYSPEIGYETPKLIGGSPLPSMKSLTSRGLNHSPGALRHFKELLHQEQTSRTNLLQQSEISLLKDIVKADERHRRLQRADYKLLKEILVGQLKEISQQERVIKMALKKLRTRGENEVEVTTLKVDSAEQPMEDAPKSARPRSKHRTQEHTRAAKSQRTPRQEVDVIFRNVPSLEKEIQILRSLGLKLEETLNKSNEKATPQRAIILHEVQKRHVAHCLHYACGEVHSEGMQVLSGKAQEFEIRHQTIDELKVEREFYIPTDIVNFTLQRTDFRNLSRNPELFLRRLRPLTKGSPMKFNLIEQDPIFFNHFLQKMCNIYGETPGSYPTYFPQSLDSPKKDSSFFKNGSGDHRAIADNKEESLELTALNPKSSSNSSMGKRRKKKRCSTPIPSNKEAPAKNKLIRNVLFGAMQVSMLLAVATAIWYPDIVCV